MIIDAHVHVWDLSSGSPVDYPWLTAELPLLYRTYRLDELAPQLDAAGVTGVVLVQAADSIAETDELIRVARRSARPARVVGWLPLADPGATVVALQKYRSVPELVGVRHLIHDDPDPRWLLRPAVAQGMELIAEAGLTFDAVAERPDLLAQVPVIARRHPGMTVVLDHLGKPQVGGELGPWTEGLRAAAAEPNVVAKISGLGTVSPPDWTAADWQPYVDIAVQVFGPDRLMVGGDWPVALQAGSYQQVMDATIRVLSGLADDERAAVLSGTASRVYRVAV